MLPALVCAPETVAVTVSVSTMLPNVALGVWACPLYSSVVDPHVMVTSRASISAVVDDCWPVESYW